MATHTRSSFQPGAVERLFPAHLLHAAWADFQPAGYHQPVTGVIYRGEPRPTCGMPLGGLDTGCLDIEPNGMLGYCTIFNQLIDPRWLVNLPFLGLSVEGRTWVLVSDTLAKEDTPRPNQSIVTFPPTDYTPRYHDIGLRGVSLAQSIDYWGHYPIVDMEFDIDAPVSVGLRAWSPFMPGDTVTSMAPATVFEAHVRNPGRKRRKGALAFSFPGFEVSNDDDARAAVRRTTLTDDVQGVWIDSGGPAAW